LSFVGAVVVEPGDKPGDAGSTKSDGKVGSDILVPSYAAVTGQPSTQVSGAGVVTMQEAAVSAMYVEKAENDRRAASFIVSGLPTSNSSTDRQRVTQLLESELGVCPVITYTKRLGQSSSTKIQPLLVYLRDTSQAQYTVSHARRLRQSNDPFVKNTIYVNMNLTKAAAHAAYEMRCRRRQATSRQSASRRATQPHGTV